MQKGVQQRIHLGCSIFRRAATVQPSIELAPVSYFTSLVQKLPALLLAQDYILCFFVLWCISLLRLPYQNVTDCMDKCQELISHNLGGWGSPRSGCQRAGVLARMYVFLVSRDGCLFPVCSVHQNDLFFLVLGWGLASSEMPLLIRTLILIRIMTLRNHNYVLRGYISKHSHIGSQGFSI